jgi:hypothetical protein
MSGSSVTLYSSIPILFGHGFGKSASDPLSLLEIHPSIEVAQSFPATGKLNDASPALSSNPAEKTAALGGRR